MTIVEPQLLLLHHHPDLANRPEPRPGHVASDTLRAALLWNVFRTLSLVSPPFWLRRLRARLVGLSSVEHAPQILEVRTWPRLAAGAGGEDGDAAPLGPRERRRRLRDANAALVRHIARITGLSHSQVNAELNRRVGVERVGEATLEQLERRRDHAMRWLEAA